MFPRFRTSKFKVWVFQCIEISRFIFFLQCCFSIHL